MRRTSSSAPIIALTLQSHLKGYNEGIEWEELPSLSSTLDRRLINPESGGNKARPIVPSVLGGAWDQTLPAELDVLPPPSPFREALQGLSMREVYEPELFRHFFGDGTVKG